MVIIESYNWGEFEAPSLEEAKEKMVNCLAQHDETNVDIDNVFINGVQVDEAKTREILCDIESEIQEWLKIAAIERTGFIRAQQDAMEG